MLPFSEYFKCINCGFTFSPTVFEMSDVDFATLNIVFHEYIENPGPEKKGNQPPYVEQGLMLNILQKNNLIDLSNSLDFAGGYGTLNKILIKYFDLQPMKIFDPYMQDLNSGNYVAKQNLKKYSTVFNSAIFEHVRNRKTLNEINDCVSQNGVLIIHTVVCENIPKDPDWFYIKPVHCAFHTNKSMSILMKQWDYEWSLYSPSAKTWVLFKNELNGENKIIDHINTEFQTDFFHANGNGFMDYWKGF